MAKKVNVEDLIPEELQDGFDVDDIDDDDEDSVITVVMQDGVERECQIIAIYEIEGQDYVALLPLEQIEDAEVGEEVETDVFFYRYDEKGDEIQLSILGSDEEFNVVREVFEQIIEESDEE